MLSLLCYLQKGALVHCESRLAGTPLDGDAATELHCFSGLPGLREVETGDGIRLGSVAGQAQGPGDRINNFVPTSFTSPFQTCTQQENMAKEILKKSGKRKRRSSSAGSERSVTPDESQTEEALLHQLGIRGRQLKLKTIQRYDELTPESRIGVLSGLQRKRECTFLIPSLLRAQEQVCFLISDHPGDIERGPGDRPKCRGLPGLGREEVARSTPHSL